MDAQLSYVRLLVGDNSRSAPFYTDDQIHAAAYIGPTRPPFPINLRMSGFVGKVKFLLPNGAVPLSLATLTDAQLAALTDAQLASMTD